MNPIADGAYSGIAPICMCGHYDGSHETIYVHMFGRKLPHGPCHAGANSVQRGGTRCTCTAFVDRSMVTP